eukprot:GFYU01000821.1.p1 GENE.GFYU01000821.1~~GFYU01000821.1.p1  ORF type:complete len:317 (-),score=32.03 GFYU01000821.1:220-1170(-)
MRSSEKGVQRGVGDQQRRILNVVSDGPEPGKLSFSGLEAQGGNAINDEGGADGDNTLLNVAQAVGASRLAYLQNDDDDEPPSILEMAQSVGKSRLAYLEQEDDDAPPNFETKSLIQSQKHEGGVLGSRGNGSTVPSQQYPSAACAVGAGIGGGEGSGNPHQQFLSPATRRPQSGHNGDGGAQIAGPELSTGSPLVYSDSTSHSPHPSSVQRTPLGRVHYAHSSGHSDILAFKRRRWFLLALAVNIFVVILIVIWIDTIKFNDDTVTSWSGKLAHKSTVLFISVCASACVWALTSMWKYLSAWYCRRANAGAAVAAV